MRAEVPSMCRDASPRRCRRHCCGIPQRLYLSRTHTGQRSELRGRTRHVWWSASCERTAKARPGAGGAHPAAAAKRDSLRSSMRALPARGAPASRSAPSAASGEPRRRSCAGAFITTGDGTVPNRSIELWDTTGLTQRPIVLPIEARRTRALLSAHSGSAEHNGRRPSNDDGLH